MPLEVGPAVPAPPIEPLSGLIGEDLKVCARIFGAEIKSSSHLFDNDLQPTFYSMGICLGHLDFGKVKCDNNIEFHPRFWA